MNFQYQVRLTLNQCNLTYEPTSKLSLYTFAKALDIWLFGQSTLEKVTQLSSWDFGRLCWLGHRCWTLCQRARTSYDFLSAPFNMTKVAGEDIVLTKNRIVWRLARLLFIFPLEELLQDCWRVDSSPARPDEWLCQEECLLALRESAKAVLFHRISPSDAVKKIAQVSLQHIPSSTSSRYCFEEDLSSS